MRELIWFFLMSETRTIYSIQLLRGAAALLVLLEHVRLEMGLTGYGAVGVDLFFVISGFIIYYVTQSDHRYFLLKRILRIVPLYWAATFCVASIAIIRPSLLNSATFSVEHLLLSLAFIPHWSEVQGFRPMLSLGWTLNYEMMFYFIFFIAMRLNHTYRAEISAFLLSILIIATNILIPPESKNGLTFYQSTIQLEFIIGMFIARFLGGYALPTGRAAYFLTLATLLFIFATNAHPSGIRLLDFGLSATFLFVAVLLGDHLFSFNTYMRQISIFGGEISYALYLCHIYLMAALSRILGLEGVLFWLGAFIIIPLFSWGIHRIIEKPINRRFRNLLRS